MGSYCGYTRAVPNGVIRANEQEKKSASCAKPIAVLTNITRHVGARSVEPSTDDGDLTARAMRSGAEATKSLPTGRDGFRCTSTAEVWSRRGQARQDGLRLSREQAKRRRTPTDRASGTA